ncbi:MAG TPA: fructosamine kinase family protein [Chitinophagaceae bacterium]|nr:fructosamine kinase family protein [Chitinophagaceae bacterium]
MINASIQKYLNQCLSDKLKVPISQMQFYPVGGGSINDTYKLVVTDHHTFFVKVNLATQYPELFQKERKGLEFLGNQNILRIPPVIVDDEIDNYQFLVLGWIGEGLRTDQFWKKFGKQLAALHHVTNPYFGFEEDNYMGALAQQNDQYSNWSEFFVHCRLQPQVKRAKENRMLHANHLNSFENLYEALKDIFNNEQPALLHGDLWSGNFMCDRDSVPVLIDPAVYFGHRSMDLAMTTLFGGFDKSFYEAYNYHYPFPNNYHEQWDVCNLYPLLIHLNLFGAGYLGQIERTLRRFQ